MKILITGSNGFLGKSLVKKISSTTKYKIIALDKEHNYECNNVTFLNKDITLADSIEDCFQGVDVVVHYASIADIHEANINPLNTMNVNLIGTINILNLCVKYKVKRFIFSSSVYVNSNQGGLYKVSKKACEEIIMHYGAKFNLKYTIMKLGSLYGPGGNSFNFIYNSLRSALKHNRIDRPGDGNELREYIHIDDVNSFVISKFKNLNIDSENIIVSGLQLQKVSDILNIINEILGGKIEINYQKNKKFEGHYKYTSYSYSNFVTKKVILENYIDIGAGIIDCINDIKNNENL